MQAVRQHPCLVQVVKGGRVQKWSPVTTHNTDTWYMFTLRDAYLKSSHSNQLGMTDEAGTPTVN